MSTRPICQSDGSGVVPHVFSPMGDLHLGESPSPRYMMQVPHPTAKPNSICHLFMCSYYNTQSACFFLLLLSFPTNTVQSQSSPVRCAVRDMGKSTVVHPSESPFPEIMVANVLILGTLSLWYRLQHAFSLPAHCLYILSSISGKRWICSNCDASATTGLH